MPSLRRRKRVEKLVSPGDAAVAVHPGFPELQDATSERPLNGSSPLRRRP